MLTKLKVSKGSHLKPESEWLVSMMMLGDCVIALNPWTKRERKVKQFRAVTLPFGMVWQQFCDIQSSGFFRQTMKLPQGFDTTASIELPMPTSLTSKQLGLESPSMELMKKKMQQLVDDSGDLETKEDELDDVEVSTA